MSLLNIDSSKISLFGTFTPSPRLQTVSAMSTSTWNPTRTTTTPSAKEFGRLADATPRANEMGPQRSLKFLTPSSALRHSRLRSPLCISAFPTILFFSAGFSFSCFKHCRIQPAINQLLILEPRSWPINKWWNMRSESTCSCPLIC